MPSTPVGWSISLLLLNRAPGMLIAGSCCTADRRRRKPSSQRATLRSRRRKKSRRRVGRTSRPPSLGSRSQRSSRRQAHYSPPRTAQPSARAHRTLHGQCPSRSSAVVSALSRLSCVGLDCCAGNLRDKPDCCSMLQRSYRGNCGCCFCCCAVTLSVSLPLTLPFHAHCLAIRMHLSSG